MFISEDILESINQIFTDKGFPNPHVQIKGSVSGGSINSCYRVQVGDTHFFLKVNDAAKFPQMFVKEAEGLKLIRDTHTVAVPDVIATGSTGDEQFLLLSWIEPGRKNDESQKKAGEELAAMHRQSNDVFGLYYDNYMGSLTQSNAPHNNWSVFFREERILPQLEIARNKALIDIVLYEKILLVLDRLDSLFPEDNPALIHGDLWSGNYMTGRGDIPVLIDPAVTFGNREADIAMTTLFGGFSRKFYDSYNSCYPLQRGWEERMDLWNLYPLLIHLNLFGSSYLQPVKGVAEKYI